MSKIKKTSQAKIKEQQEKAKTEIINKYASFVKKNMRHPTRADMLKADISRAKISHHFGSLTTLRKIVKEAKPEFFDGIIDESLFTPKVFQQLKREVANKRRFIITTAVAGCKVHRGFLASLKKYCQVNNAVLLILPSYDPAHNLDNDPNWALDNVLAKENIVFQDLRLNSNVFISSIKINAKAIQPLTGLKRIGQRNGSFIYASPKQMMQPVTTSNAKIPRVLRTTGACTEADYSTTRLSGERTAYIADNDHVLGALIVEIKDNRVFFCREVQAETGSGFFADLGRYYQGNRVGLMAPSKFVIADWHSQETDHDVVENWFEVSKYSGCQDWVLHDIFSGNSINHHEKNKKILLAQLEEQGLLNLKSEFEAVGADLTYMVKRGIRQIDIVKSNHDEFLDRNLEDGDYAKEPRNLRVSLHCALAQLDGEDPLRFGVEKFGKISAKVKARIKWLDRDDDHKIANIELGAHGDLGANGSRGSVTSLENTYGNCVVGHSHSPSIIRGVWTVGTSTFLKLRYNRGPSSWANASVLIYPNGSRQMIFSIYGEWRLPPKRKK